MAVTSRSRQTKQLLLEIISLSTARGRLLFFGLATLVILVMPYAWLANLSLWQRIGWESAPSIGLTRAYWLFIHGDPLAAWQRNWLIYPVITIVLILIITDYRKLRNRPGKTILSAFGGER